MGDDDNIDNYVGGDDDSYDNDHDNDNDDDGGG